MGIEIERKYLVNAVPAEAAAMTGHAIRQGYVVVAEGGVELRVRQKGDRYFQTLKMGRGLSRTEIEIELSRDQFEHLWPYTANRRLSKTRYTLPVGAQTVELDRFDGHLAGLVLAEVEFPSVNASRLFSPPSWLGREVTEDERYTNRQLAIHGIPGK